MIHDIPSETYPDEGTKNYQERIKTKSHMNYLENDTSLYCI